MAYELEPQLSTSLGIGNVNVGDLMLHLQQRLSYLRRACVAPCDQRSCVQSELFLAKCRCFCTLVSVVCDVHASAIETAHKFEYALHHMCTPASKQLTQMFQSKLLAYMTQLFFFCCFYQQGLRCYRQIGSDFGALHLRCGEVCELVHLVEPGVLFGLLHHAEWSPRRGAQLSIEEHRRCSATQVCYVSNALHKWLLMSQS